MDPEPLDISDSEDGSGSGSAAVGGDADGDADQDVDQENERLAEQERWIRVCNNAFKYWWSPLHVAVEKGHKDIVNALIKRSGARSTVHDSSHGVCSCEPVLYTLPDVRLEPATFTALHIAICSQRYDVANPNTRWSHPGCLRTP